MYIEQSLISSKRGLDSFQAAAVLGYLVVLIAIRTILNCLSESSTALTNTCTAYGLCELSHCNITKTYFHDIRIFFWREAQPGGLKDTRGIIYSFQSLGWSLGAWWEFVPLAPTAPVPKAGHHQLLYLHVCVYVIWKRNYTYLGGKGPGILPFQAQQRHYYSVWFPWLVM